MRNQLVTLLLVPGVLWTFQISPAKADVTLTLQQSAETTQTQPAPQTAQVFYKGSNARLEVAGGPVVLYDGKAGIIHTLDTAHKTYYTTLFAQIQQTNNPPSSGAANPAKEDYNLAMRRTDQTQTIAGMTARKYTLTGTIQFTQNAPLQGHRGGGGGHHRGGGGSGFPGGFPLAEPLAVAQNDGGGERNYGGRSGNSGSMPQWSLSGEIWLSDTVKFPDKTDALLMAQFAAASAGPFLQPLTDALGKQKGIPLLARITVTRTPPPAASGAVDQFGVVNADSPPPAQIPAMTMATTLTIQSVITTPIDDKLFQTPLDYSLIAAPTSPFIPGMPAVADTP